MNKILSSLLALAAAIVTAVPAAAQDAKPAAAAEAKPAAQEAKPAAPVAAPAAAPEAKAGDQKAGAMKAAMCIGCHNIPGYQASFPEIYKVPKIAGQNAKYIAA